MRILCFEWYDSAMPTSPLPSDRTKVSYILDKQSKSKLEAAAKAAGVSMSEVISEALVKAGILIVRKVIKKAKAKKKAA